MLPKKNCIVCLSEAVQAVKLTKEIGISFFIPSSIRRLLNHNQIETFISCQIPTAIQWISWNQITDSLNLEELMHWKSWKSKRLKEQYTYTGIKSSSGAYTSKSIFYKINFKSYRDYTKEYPGYAHLFFSRPFRRNITCTSWY